MTNKMLKAPPGPSAKERSAPVQVKLQRIDATIAPTRLMARKGNGGGALRPHSEAVHRRL